MEVDEDNIPEDLACPICMQLPDDEIFLCKNGHSICRKCCRNIKYCPQCRIPYAAGLVRNRAMESFIGSMKSCCPFKVNGCSQIIKRKEMTDHKEICRYNGKHVQVCKLIGYSCEFWTNAANIDEAISHLKSVHDLRLHKGSKASINLVNVLSATTQANLEGKMREVTWRPVLMECAYKDFGNEDCSKGKASGATPTLASIKEQFIFLTQQHTADNTMSWIMLYLGESLKETSRFEVEFEIKSYSSKIPDLKWKAPCAGLLQTKYCDSRVPISFLEMNYFIKGRIGHDYLSISFRILKSGLDLSLAANQTVVEKIWNVFTPKGSKDAQFCNFCFANYEDNILLFKCRLCVPSFHVCGECIEIGRQQRICQFEIVNGDFEWLKTLQLEPVFQKEDPNAS